MKYFLFTFWLAFIASPSLAQGLSGTIELSLTIVPSCQVQSPNQNEHIANDAKVNYPQIHCQRGGGLVSEPKISHSFIATDGSLLSQTSNSQMTQLMTVEW